MNILHAGKVLPATDGDGISLDAAGVEALRLALNGGGPLTIQLIAGTLHVIHGFMPVPEKEPPSNVIARPELDAEYQATRSAPVENARAEVPCSKCNGAGRLFAGYDVDSNQLVDCQCPACGGSGKESP